MSTDHTHERILKDDRVTYENHVPKMRLYWYPSLEEVGVFSPERAERLMDLLNGDNFGSPANKQVCIDYFVDNEKKEQLADDSLMKKGIKETPELIGVPATTSKALKTYDETTRPDTIKRSKWLTGDGKEYTIETRTAGYKPEHVVTQVKTKAKGKGKPKKTVTKAGNVVHYYGYSLFDDNDIAPDGFTSFLVRGGKNA